MVGHRAKSKMTARRAAARARRRGLKASIYKRKKGYGISVRRK